MVVPVGAGLFMIEAQGVEQLMLHSVVVDAALAAQGQGLLVVTAANIRVAPKEYFRGL